MFRDSVASTALPGSVLGDVQGSLQIEMLSNKVPGPLRAPNHFSLGKGLTFSLTPDLVPTRQ